MHLLAFERLRRPQQCAVICLAEMCVDAHQRPVPRGSSATRARSCCTSGVGSRAHVLRAAPCLNARRSRLLCCSAAATSYFYVGWLDGSYVHAYVECFAECFARQRVRRVLRSAPAPPGVQSASLGIGGLARCRALCPSQLVHLRLAAGRFARAGLYLMHVCRDPAPPCRCLLGVVRRVFSCFGRMCGCLGSTAPVVARTDRHPRLAVRVCRYMAE